jgi:sigma-B regulation protein RsbU (phosphoserine phosphatase)
MTQLIPISDKSREILEIEIRLKQLELESLLEMTQAINSNLPEDALYKIYNFTLRANLSIGKLALYVFGKTWECKVSFGTEKDYYRLPISESVLMLSETTKVDTLPFNEAIEEFEHIVPVLYQRGVLAYVLVGGMLKNDQLEASSISFIQTISNIMLVAIENKKLIKSQLEQEALKREIQIAKQVQTLLFPKQLPDLEKLKVFASYQPHQTVGGDYYDFVRLTESTFLFCIADVSGKGIPAALLMSNFQASLRTLVRQTSDLKEIVRELNFLIKENSSGEHFITFFMAIYDTSTHTLKYINAGHNPPVMVFEDGRIHRLEKGTTIMGVFDPLPFVNEDLIEVDENFLFFAFTDGLTEVTNPADEEFGAERLEDFLSQNHLRPLSSLHESLMQYVNEYKGSRNYSDDITMLSVRIAM